MSAVQSDQSMVSLKIQYKDYMNDSHPLRQWHASRISLGKENIMKNIAMRSLGLLLLLGALANCSQSRNSLYAGQKTEEL